MALSMQHFNHMMLMHQSSGIRHHSICLVSTRQSWRLHPALLSPVVPRIRLQLNALDDIDASESVRIGSSFPTALEIMKSAGLPIPAVSHQKRPAAFKEIKALRTYSNNLAREDRLPRIICGSQGITSNFIFASADILCKAPTDKENGNFLRVKLGEGAGVERKEAAKALELLLDAIVVYEVGYTITLYREAGLPRPSNTIRAQSQVAEEEDAKFKAATTSPRVRITAQMRSEAAKKELKAQPKPPPEFQVTSS